MASEKTPWIGVVLVSRDDDWSGYSDEPMGGAYTNVIAFASSASQFRAAAVTALSPEGFSVDEIEDDEPLVERRKLHDLDDDLEELVAWVERTKQPAFAALHMFPIEEEHYDQ